MVEVGPRWIRLSKESCDPHLVLPPNPTPLKSAGHSADLGEGEGRVGMKREIINSDYEMWLVALRELQSATGEELRPHFGRTLLPSAEGATTRPMGGTFKREYL